MLAVERRNIIIEQLKSEKKVVVSQLSGLFNVSDETIRRDLDRLCREGVAAKSYGGAVLMENDNSIDFPFNVRKDHQSAEKKKIAELIEDLVQDGESVILDASTTAVFAAKLLKSKKRLTVITNSIEVMLELADMTDGRGDWRVLSTGGSLKGDYFALVGPHTMSGLAPFYADKLIFSCKGLDAKRGIFDSNDDFAQVKRAMLQSARVKILAADLTKFDKIAFSKIADIGDIDVVVTDTQPDERWMDGLDMWGVQCVWPE